MRICLVLFSLWSYSALAQVGVKVDGVSTDENTTIEIRKGDKSKTENQFEITEGIDEINGDPSPLLQEARKNWKKSCEEWKKELKDLNKTNQVLSMSCGAMSCSTQATESSCKSQSKYKLRVQIR